jgi:hypothetical protein
MKLLKSLHDMHLLYTTRPCDRILSISYREVEIKEEIECIDDKYRGVQRMT